MSVAIHLPVLNGRSPSISDAIGCCLRDTFRDLPTAICIVDAYDRIRLANRRAAAILGTTPQELEQMTIGAILQPTEQMRSESRRAKDGRAILPATTRSGRMISIGYSVSEVSIACFAPDGTGKGSAVVFQDVTASEQLRQERDRLLQLASLHASLPTVLHELRNPLATIVACLEVQIESSTGMSDDDKVQLHAVLTEARRMALSLEGVGSVGRPLVSNRLEAVDFACREAFRIMSGRASNQSIRTECDVEHMPLLGFDSAMIRAIVFNLLNNSIQACGPGALIRLGARLHEGKVLLIEVEDTGCGMDAETLARCRELFFTTKTRGSGIGLALCADAAQAAGGRLDIKSTVGVGTTVRLEVPLPAVQPKRASAEWRFASIQRKGE